MLNVLTMIIIILVQALVNDRKRRFHGNTAVHCSSSPDRPHILKKIIICFNAFIRIFRIKRTFKCFIWTSDTFDESSFWWYCRWKSSYTIWRKWINRIDINQKIINRLIPWNHDTSRDGSIAFGRSPNKSKVHTYTSISWHGPCGVFPKPAPKGSHKHADHIVEYA